MVFKFVLTFGLVVCGVVMDVNEEFVLPALPQVVSLLDSESESDGELNMMSLDKTLQPEDFADDFGYVCIFLF